MLKYGDLISTYITGVRDMKVKKVKVKGLQNVLNFVGDLPFKIAQEGPPSRRAVVVLGISGSV